MSHRPKRRILEFVYGDSVDGGERVIRGARLEECLHVVGFRPGAGQLERRATREKICTVCPEIGGRGRRRPPLVEQPEAGNFRAIGGSHDPMRMQALERLAVVVASFLTLPPGPARGGLLEEMERLTKQAGTL